MKDSKVPMACCKQSFGHQSSSHNKLHVKVCLRVMIYLGAPPASCNLLSLRQTACNRRLIRLLCKVRVILLQIASSFSSCNVSE